MRRRIRVRPPKAAMILSLFTGVIFCLIGVFIVIPQAGIFGILWTLIAFAITVTNAVIWFGKDGRNAQEILIDDGEDAGISSRPSDRETRLQELQNLYNKRLITREEYDAKREEILKEL